MTHPARGALVAALAAILLLSPVALPAAAQTTTPDAGVALPEGSDADPGAQISAQGALLIEPATATVLWSRDADTPRPIASLTKIMTALLAVEAGSLDDVVTVSPIAVATGAQPGAASLGLHEGQQIPMRSLLEGLLVRSGNDAAVAVAEHVAGDEATFVAAMNTRAAELGMDATRFHDASGLGTDLPNVSSPRDLARLTEVALAHPPIARWVATPVVNTPHLPALPNRNLLLRDYPGATGVKTGYTSVAGLCLIASATRDGRVLLAIVLDSERSFADAAALLDHGFVDWRRAAPALPGASVGVYRWAETSVALVADDLLAATLPADENASWRLVLDPVHPLPVAAGVRLGEAELYVGGERVDSVELRSAAAVGAPEAPSPAAAVGWAVQEALRGYARLEPVERAA